MNIGGRVIFTYPYPCIFPPLSFWSLTLQPIPTLPTIAPVTYPYLVPKITKAWFLSGVKGVTTLGTGPPGVCVTIIPCDLGLDEVVSLELGDEPSDGDGEWCVLPLVLPSASVTTQYGSAINTGLGL